ncbi:DUF4386 family protein [Streptomyces sp. NBC_01465]|uniref:DUF4386 family protein n=1 Tax=Streptomyces sp. NBC_01465 TaxID=2903878 RepID=UPI002E330FAB|nr:DUF4386 family protein [Streptomyces sp. NBC_01465]
MTDTKHLAAPVTAAPLAAGLRTLATAALGVVAVGSVVNALFAVLTPGGDPHNGFSYGDAAGHRDRFWAMFAYGGPLYALFCVGLAFAVLVLVRQRGAALARIGSVLLIVSGALVSSGFGGVGVLYGYATNSAALPTASGHSFVAYINDHTDLYTNVLAPSALAQIVGSVLVCIALFRARSVPRWLSALFIVGMLLSFAISSGAAGFVAALPSAVATVAIAWYARERTTA